MNLRNCGSSTQEILVKFTLKKIALGIASAGLLIIYGCGGGDIDNAAPVNSPINFSGNSNGESVIDANNQYVKFLTASRSMEVFSGTTTDITLDSSYNIIKGGNTLIGSVSLIAGSNNSTIAGLVSKSGTILGVNTSSDGATLVATNTPVPKPGTGSSGRSGSLAACKLIAYPGDKSDIQTYA